MIVPQSTALATRDFRVGCAVLCAPSPYALSKRRPGDWPPYLYSTSCPILQSCQKIRVYPPVLRLVLRSSRGGGSLGEGGCKSMVKKFAVIRGNYNHSHPPPGVVAALPAIARYCQPTPNQGHPPLSTPIRLFARQKFINPLCFKNRRIITKSTKNDSKKLLKNMKILCTN
jgi:hypothetical protein